MKKIVIDLDGTLTQESELAYEDKLPNLPVISKLKDLALNGYYIVIHTARNMKTYKGNVGLINANTLPVIIEWLQKHQVPYDEIVVGKPWCDEGYYVDDRCLRPSEFSQLTESQIQDLFAREHQISKGATL